MLKRKSPVKYRFFTGKEQACQKKKNTKKKKPVNDSKKPLKNSNKLVKRDKNGRILAGSGLPRITTIKAQ